MKHTDVLVIDQFLTSTGEIYSQEDLGICKRQWVRLRKLAEMAQRAGLMPGIIWPLHFTSKTMHYYFSNLQGKTFMQLMWGELRGEYKIVIGTRRPSISSGTGISQNPRKWNIGRESSGNIDIFYLEWKVSEETCRGNRQGWPTQRRSVGSCSVSPMVLLWLKLWRWLDVSRSTFPKTNSGLWKCWWCESSTGTNGLQHWSTNYRGLPS